MRTINQILAGVIVLSSASIAMAANTFELSCPSANGVQSFCPKYHANCAIGDLGEFTVDSNTIATTSNQEGITFDSMSYSKTYGVVCQYDVGKPSNIGYSNLSLSYKGYYLSASAGQGSWYSVSVNKNIPHINCSADDSASCSLVLIKNYGK